MQDLCGCNLELAFPFESPLQSNLCEVRAIISDDPVESLTQSISESFPDVIQNLGLN